MSYGLEGPRTKNIGIRQLQSMGEGEVMKNVPEFHGCVGESTLLYNVCRGKVCL